jgi:Tetratricopeptide repeat.
MGTYFLHIGDLEAGKSCSGQALDLLEGEDDRWGLRKKILSSLSIVFGEIGQYENALECAQEAVELCEYENDAKSFPFCLNNQACLLMDIEDRESARDTLLAALESTYETKELRIRALILNNLAMCSLGKAEGTDEVEEVKGFLDQALDIARQIGSLKLEALTFNNLGIFYQVSGKPDEARESYLKALSLFKKIGDRPDEAVTLVNLGQLFHDYLHDSETTSKLCKEAIDIIETIRGGTQEGNSPHFLCRKRDRPVCAHD